MSTAKKDDKKKKNRLQGGAPTKKPTAKAPAAASAAQHTAWEELKPDVSKLEEQGRALQALSLKTQEPRDAPQGLCFIKDFITEEEEARLLAFFAGQPWDPDTHLERRTQQWGYAFDYEAMTVLATSKPLPDEVGFLMDRMLGIKENHARNTASGIVSTFPFCPRRPEQLIVNEYTHGQGIHAHVDRLCFGPCIASLSLGAPCHFVVDHVEDSHVSRVQNDFCKVPSFARMEPADGSLKIQVPPRALILMKGDMRYRWTHCIPPRRSVGTRISLTFRTMTDEALQRVGQKFDLAQAWAAPDTTANGARS